MNRDEFIAANPIDRVLEGKRVVLIGNGRHRKALCPFHEDKTPSLSVDTEQGLWKCFAGCGGGSVIDLVMKFEGKTVAQVLSNGNSDKSFRRYTPPPDDDCPFDNPPPTPAPKQELGTPSKIYDYTDELGVLAYQVLRFDKPEGKTFRQRQPDRKGGWIWKMDGAIRVLYRAPEVKKSQTVAIAEGEKDADTLTDLGFCGTAHVGGAKNWLDAYAQQLTGKDLLLFHDNDPAGQDWRQSVFDACAGKCKTVRVITLPKAVKDVSDYALTFSSKEECRRALDSIIENTAPFISGVKVPIYTMAELEASYSRHCSAGDTDGLNLAKWLPSFNRMRRVFPGELILLIGDTGVGKTAIVNSVANSTTMKTLVFELELPRELMFERNIAAKMKSFTCEEAEKNYARGDMVGEHVLNRLFPNLFLCFEGALTADEIESLIIRSELKIGAKPQLVILDYIQLVKGKGDRYERTSDTAERLRMIAKSTRTIIFVVSQVNRKSSDDEIGLHSAKDSGSLENSASIVIAGERFSDDPTALRLKVLKSTKGGAGLEIMCNYDGARMQITERSKILD